MEHKRTELKRDRNKRVEEKQHQRTERDREIKRKEKYRKVRKDDSSWQSF